MNTEFYVDGKGIPDVDFDVGPSWAGLLPISSKANETRKVFFVPSLFIYIVDSKLSALFLVLSGCRGWKRQQFDFMVSTRKPFKLRLDD